MGKKLFVLLMMFSLLLCACGALPEEPAARVPAEVPETAVPTAAVTLPAITEATQVPHSYLYHPDYTQEQILEYFEEVVLQVEYTDGIGDATLVQKWLAPIAYRIYGTPTEEDLAVLNGLFAQLNQIPGFPGFYTAEVEGLEQLRISFLEPDVFRDSFSQVVGGEDATGATHYWYYTDTNEIHSARIGYRTDIEQSQRNSVLVEEIINTLGITDTVLRSDSVTYQYSDANTALSEVDWILLKLLYHPDVQCGMDAMACEAVLREIYF